MTNEHDGQDQVGGRGEPAAAFTAARADGRTAGTRAAFTAADARRAVVAPRAGDDKYARGVVGLVTGSAVYPGAARLGAEAAVRSGCGIVRYLGPDAIGAGLLHARPELVLGRGHCDALVAGSGIRDVLDELPAVPPGVSPGASAGAFPAASSDSVSVGSPGEPGDGRAAIIADAMLRGTPTVLDAGALSLVGRWPRAAWRSLAAGQWPAGAERPAPSADAVPLGNVVLTPHAREFARLARRVLDRDEVESAGLSSDALDRDESEFARNVQDAPEAWASLLARATGATVLLKGATTIVAAPDGRARRVEAPTSVLASAGSGDVLAGLLGALLAVASARDPVPRAPAGGTD
ncbi:MAG: ADP-dependent NAD(P)H-hydrate dehydratase, partial [Pseudoclavibacter sp.]